MGARRSRGPGAAWVGAACAPRAEGTCWEPLVTQAPRSSFLGPVGETHGPGAFPSRLTLYLLLRADPARAHPGQPGSWGGTPGTGDKGTRHLSGSCRSPGFSVETPHARLLSVSANRGAHVHKALGEGDRRRWNTGKMFFRTHFQDLS